MCNDDGGVGTRIEGDYILSDAEDHFLGRFLKSSEVVSLSLLTGDASSIGLGPRIHWFDSHDSRHFDDPRPAMFTKWGFCIEN